MSVQRRRSPRARSTRERAITEQNGTGVAEPAALALAGGGANDVRELTASDGLGRAIKGPSALGSDRKRLWHLTWALAKTEFKLTFFGSALGYLWQLMRPLMLFGVIYVVFTHVARFGAKGPFYPAALLLGIVLFTFYSESTGGSVPSLVNRENLVRKIEFPRLAVPLSTVLTALFTVTLNMVPVFIFLVAAGGRARMSWLELPVLVVLLAAFTAGLGMILSVGYVRFRDVKPIWEVVLQMTFYASGIFFVIVPVVGVKESGIKPANVFGVHVNIAHVLMANPFAAILQQARHSLIDPRYQSAAQAMGGGAMILIPIAIALTVIVVGFVIFDREAPRVAEQL